MTQNRTQKKRDNSFFLSCWILLLQQPIDFLVIVIIEINVIFARTNGIAHWCIGFVPIKQICSKNVGFCIDSVIACTNNKKINCYHRPNEFERERSIPYALDILTVNHTRDSMLNRRGSAAILQWCLDSNSWNETLNSGERWEIVRSWGIHTHHAVRNPPMNIYDNENKMTI